MIESFRTIYKGGVGKIVEKKSKFICTIVPIETEEAAIEFIEQTKKKYWDASHNCSAYVIGMRDDIQRCSDDGEPSKTAGKPMLDVLLGEGIHNAAAVVTRYFGGTLLGTGGLVRAYQSSLKEGLNNCIIIEKLSGVKVEIITDYTGIGKLQYIASGLNVSILHSDYTDIVISTALIPAHVFPIFQKQMIEVTNGTVKITQLEDLYYANVSGEILLF